MFPVLVTSNSTVQTENFKNVFFVGAPTTFLYSQLSFTSLHIQQFASREKKKTFENNFCSSNQILLKQKFSENFMT